MTPRRYTVDVPRPEPYGVGGVRRAPAQDLVGGWSCTRVAVEDFPGLVNIGCDTMRFVGDCLPGADAMGLDSADVWGYWDVDRRG